METSNGPDDGISYLDGVMIIQPPQELLDRLEIATLSDAWLKAIEEKQPQRVVMSFDQVRHFGSEAIGVVIRISKRIRAYGGDIRLCSMGKLVRQIFEVCQLIPTLFQTYDSTADAISSFDK
jgi:anti-anti-sigma factor